MMVFVMVEDLTLLFSTDNGEKLTETRSDDAFSRDESSCFVWNVVVTLNAACIIVLNAYSKVNKRPRIATGHRL